MVRSRTWSLRGLARMATVAVGIVYRPLALGLPNHRIMTLRPAIAPARATAIAVLAAVVALLALAGPALAADTSIARGHREIDTSRVLLAQSLQAYKSGDRDRAYTLSKKAYLDHFEFVEIPLRLRDPNLVLDTEFKYAALRNDIRDGAPVSKIRSDTAIVRSALVDVDRALARKGLAAPAVAFGFSFSILFREGVEAVLLIAILLGSLAAGSASNYKRPRSCSRWRRSSSTSRRSAGSCSRR
jgi:hypothetical protein